MMNKKILKKLIVKLRTGQEPLESTDELESGIKQLTSKIRKKMEADTLGNVNSQAAELFSKAQNALKQLENIDKYQTGLTDEISGLKRNFGTNKGILDGLSTTHLLKSLEALKSESSGMYAEMGRNLQSTLDKFKKDLDLSPSKLKEELSGISRNISGIVEELENKIVGVGQNTGKAEAELKKALAEFVKFKADVLSMVSNIGGGQANRNIAVGGNTSVLSHYGDINLRAGSNVTITYAKNNTTKYTDITIAATGGSGTTRTIESTAVSSVIGAVASTDYVVLATQGVKLDLPTASGNTNLYTIKNVGASSVLITPNGADTIDTDSNLILATQFTAVDLISNGTDKWNIT